jgi:hypothetical protein
VLASVEVGRVDGVRTILNNLDVRNGVAPTTAQLPALTNPDGAQGQALTRGEGSPGDGHTGDLHKHHHHSGWIVVADPPGGIELNKDSEPRRSIPWHARCRLSTGSGSNAVTVGGQIELHPETLLRFRTAAPITTTAYKKNGAQIRLPASSGPALLPRAASEAQTQ